MKVELRDVPALQLACVCRTGPYQISAGDAFATLFAWLGKKGLNADVNRVVGFGRDDPAITPAEQQRYVAGVELGTACNPDSDAGIEVIDIPAGCYAVHRLIGPYAQMPDAFQKLVGSWLPHSGRKLDHSRPFLEFYLNDPSSVPESELLTDICIPLTPQD